MTSRQIYDEIEKLKIIKHKTLEEHIKDLKQHRFDTCSIEIPYYLKFNKI